MEVEESKAASVYDDTFPNVDEPMAAPAPQKEKKARLSVFERGRIESEDAPIPRCVSLVDPVVASAKDAKVVIKEMLGIINDVQRMMQELNLTPMPQSRATDLADQHMKDLKKGQGATKPKRREQIIGESLDNDNVALTVIPKTDETRKTIQMALSSHFLFSDLEGSGVKDVIDTMEKEEMLEGMVIIQQGDSGDKFYVLEYGSALIKVNGRTLEQTVKPGSAFGEVRSGVEPARS